MPQLLKTTALALALPCFAHAQRLKPARVPAAVQTTFQATFPTVKTIAWEKEGNKYEAGFRLNGKTMSALFAPADELLETETDMSPAQLPGAVRARLASDYQAYKVKEAATIVRADGSTVYEAEIAKGGKAQDVLFLTDGTLAK